MKKRILSLIAILVIFIAGTLAGCSSGSNSNVDLTLSTEVINITLDDGEVEEGEIKNSAKFRVTVSNAENASVLFRIENEDRIRVTSERIDSKTIEATVIGLYPGIAKIYAFTPENSNVSKQVVVNVYQPIKDIALVNGYEVYIPIGGTSSVAVDKAFVITPANGNVNSIKYQIVSDNSRTGLIVNDSGFIDARNVQTEGDVVVRAYINEDVGAEFIVHVVKSLTMQDINVQRDGNVIFNGQYVESEFSLIKTVERYQQTELSFSVTNNTSEYEVTYYCAEKGLVEIQNTAYNKFMIKALELGEAKIDFYINIKGAGTYLEPVKLTFTANVIDLPLDINLNGESGKENNGVFNTVCYNNYQVGELGTPYRFTLSPSSVLEEDAKITIEFEKPSIAVNAIVVMDTYGNRLGVQRDINGRIISMEPFQINAGETIYIKASLTRTDNQMFKFTATADITEIYQPVVRAEVNITLKEGISEFSYNRNNIYIERGENRQITLTVGSDAADKSGIYYELIGSGITVEKVNDVSYLIKAVKNGVSTLTFYSGNGFEVKINVTVYVPLTNVWITCDEPYDNGAIGNKEMTNDSLTSVSVAIKHGLQLQVTTNLNASIVETKYTVVSGSKFVGVDTNGYVTILGVGKATVRIQVYGYDEAGVMEEPIEKNVIIEGYIPVSSIALNYVNETLMDYESVGYYRISDFSQLNLSVNVYPTNATVNNQDINWTIIGSSGSIQSQTGKNNVFTAGPLGSKDSDVVKVYVTVNDRGRIHSQTCTIYVEKAVKVETIRMVNVFNQDIYFSSQNGLGKFADGMIIDDTNSFTVETSIYPANAYNKNLRYIYVPVEENEESPVFAVNAFGKVVPLRGGNAILRIAAEDSYYEYQLMSTYIDIKVTVADGKSEATAFNIYNADDLRAIGDDETTLSSYYKLASDIDLSGENWEPIGSKENPFTGTLYGYYNVGIDNLKLMSQINGLTIDKSVSGSEDEYFGLFGYILGGSVRELKLEIRSIKIDATNHTGNLYVGGLVGKTETNVIQIEDNNTYDFAELFENSVNGYLIEVTPSKGATYVGGMIGYLTGSLETVEAMPIVQIDNINILDNGYSVNNLYVGGLSGYVIASIHNEENDNYNNIIKGSYTPYISNILKSYVFGSSEGSSIYSIITNINISNNLVVEYNNDNKLNFAVGGVIGSFNSELNFENFTLHKLQGISVKANIKALTMVNVGGIVGYNNATTLTEVSFTGSVLGKYNVGGIVGYNIGQVFNAYAETYNDYIIKAEDYAGIIIGRWDYSHHFAIEDCEFNYLYSTYYNLPDDETSRIDSQGNNVGMLVGAIHGGENAGQIAIAGCVSMFGDRFVVGKLYNTSIIFDHCYIKEKVLEAGASSKIYKSYIANVEVDNALNNDMKLPTEVVSSFVSEPGFMSWIIDEESGIYRLKNESMRGESYILYNVLPTSIYFSFLNLVDDSHIFVDSNSILLYYYDMPNGFETTVSAEQLQYVQNTLKNLNTINFNDLSYIFIYFLPTPSRTVGLYLEIVGQSSANVASIDKLGNLILKGEGYVDLVIKCVGSDVQTQTIRIYIAKKVTNFKIADSSTSEGGLEFTSENKLKIRKGESGVFFSQIYNDYLGNEYDTSDFFAVEYTINDLSRNVYASTLITDVSYKDFIFNFSDKEWVNIQYYVSYMGDVYYMEEIEGKRIVIINGTQYEVSDKNIVEIDDFPYPVLLAAYSATLDDFGQVDVNTILNYEDGSFVEAGTFAVVANPLYSIPVYNTETQQTEMQIIDLAESVGTKNFAIEVYEGATSIESTIDEAFYSPSDKVVFEVTMTTDSYSDELKYTILQEYSSLSVNIEDITDYDNAIVNGKLVKKFQVETYIDNNLNADPNVFDSRYLEEEKLFNIEFYSSLLETTRVNVPITFIPQQVQRLNVYNNNTSSSISNGVIYYEMQEASTYAIPNKSSIVRVDMYPSYSYADHVTITSAEVNGAILYLEQLIQEEDGQFTKLIPGSSYTEDGYGIILQKKSVKNGDLANFTGNFYIRAQLSESVDEGTQFPLIVNAYKRNREGQLELLTTSTIVLTAVEIPEINITLLNATGSDYVVKGLTTDVQITVRTTSNMISYDCYTSVGDLVIDPTKTFDKVIYNKTLTPAKIDGKKQYYNDSIYVGIGVATGEEIMIAATVTYLLNGIEETVSASMNLRVVDFLLTDANLFSFNNETDTLNMYIEQEYRLGVENLMFEIAPEFNIARVRYQLNNNDEEEYNSYYYGGYYYQNVDKSKINYTMYQKGMYYYIDTNMVGMEVANLIKKQFTLKNGEYRDSSGKLVTEVIAEASGGIIAVESLVPIRGLLQKVSALEGQLHNDYKVFYRDIGNNTYQSLSLGINNDYYYYIRNKESNGEQIVNIIGTGISTGIKLRLDIKYGFDENLELKVYNDTEAASQSSYVSLIKDYTLNIMYNTIDDVPIPIYNMKQFMDMEADKNYILMNDIELEDWAAMDANFASLDGNSYQVIMKTFALPDDSTSINLSLFANIASGTVVKNLTVNLSMISDLNLNRFATVNFAGITINNAGTITNCQISAKPVNAVQNSNSSLRVETNINLKTKNILNGTRVMVYAGLMAVNNSGNITNSRVGDIDTATFTSPIKFTANGEIAGFVNENSGHISSCYVLNTSLENWLNVASESMTAGFVNENTGIIIGSYVRGSKLLHTSTTSDGTNINRSKDGSIASNGNVGGFVYRNSADINNCYTNIKIISNGRTAGFVFENGETGTIDACYSTSLVTRGSALHMPFIGVNDESKIQDSSVDGITNCFYLLGNGESYESSSLGDPANAIITKSFSSEISFGGFSFSLANVYDAMWVMQNGYPELVEANNISISNRVLTSEVGDRINYRYEGYDLGSKENPYLISTAKDFNNYFANSNNGETISDKYYRIIADIDFDTVSGVNATKTVELCNTFIDGNGFTIDNVRINAQTSSTSIGLFKRIYSRSSGPTAIKRYSTLKNFNLNISEASALNVAYMGGLAGIITDSNIFNVNVSSSCVMQAYNVVGGVAGLIEGNSNVFNITTSVSAQAVYKHNDTSTIPTIYSADSVNISNISHVGGVAGIVDIYDESIDANAKELASSSKVKFITVKGNISLSGEYVGGAFGYVGKETHVYDIKFELNYEDVENAQIINSTYSAGGIAGVNFGILNHVRVEHSLVYQEQIDNSLRKYYLFGDEVDRGKTNLFQGTITYLGGIVGVNYNGMILNSYSRVDLIDPNPTGDTNIVKQQYFGGIVGITYAGVFREVYSTSDILTKQIDGYTYAGGIIGRYNSFSGVVDGSDVQEISFVSVYSINAWDPNNFKTMSRNDGIYVGRVIGYTDIKMYNDDSSSKIGTFTNGVKLNDTMIIDDKDIFTFKDSEYFDYVGSGRYANDYKYTPPKSVSTGSGDEPVVTIDYTSLFSNTSDDSSLLSDFYSELAITSKWFVPPDYIFPRLTLAVQKDVDTINTVFDFFGRIRAASYKTFYIESDLDFSLLYELPTKLNKEWKDITYTDLLNAKNAALEGTNADEIARWNTLFNETDTSSEGYFDYIKQEVFNGDGSVYSNFFFKNFSGKLMSGKVASGYENEASANFMTSKKNFDANIKAITELATYKDGNNISNVQSYMDFVSGQLNLFTGESFANYELLNKELGALSARYNELDLKSKSEALTSNELLERDCLNAITTAVNTTLNNESSILNAEALGGASTETVTLSGIRLKSGTSTESVGIFKQTIRATFTNVNFVFDGLDTSLNNKLKTVGLVTANDEGSYLYDINVTYSSNAAWYGAGNLGGIIGMASATTALSNCSFTGSITINDSKALTNEINLGGLVGSGNYVKFDKCYVNMTKSLDVVGEHVLKVYNLPSNRVVNVFVGGLIGFARTLNVSECYNSTSVQVIGSNYTTALVHIGGLVGMANQISMADSLNLGDVKVDNASNASVGGLIGAGSSTGINNSNVGRITDKVEYVDIWVNNCNDSQVGGGIGEATTFNSNDGTSGMANNLYVNIKVKGTASFIIIKNCRSYIGGYIGHLTNSAASTTKILNINYINTFGTITADDLSQAYVGGIIGLNTVGKNGFKIGNTFLNNCFANNYIELGLSELLGFNYTTYVGGLVGMANHTEQDKASNVGHLHIVNCVSASKIDVSSIVYYAGGIAGSTGDNITNCYIATTICSSRFTGENTGNVDTLSAINKGISVNNLYVVDELTMNKNKDVEGYTNTKQNYDNVIAKNYLYKTQNEFINMIKSSPLFNLPVSLDNTILFPEGNVFNPIEIKVENYAVTTSFKDDKYYILTDNITLKSSISGFKGILNGNGKTITISNSINQSIIDTINTYSGISNLGVVGNVNANAILVNKNNGIIYNVYVTGTLTTGLSDSAGGVVAVNNGLLYSVGTDVRIVMKLKSNDAVNKNIGNIIGENNGMLFNSYALGGISVQSTVDAKDNSAKVTLADGSIMNLGGLVGYSEGGKISTCYTATSLYVCTNNATVRQDVIGDIDKVDGEYNYNGNPILNTNFDKFAIYTSNLSSAYKELKALDYSKLTHTESNDKVLYMSKIEGSRAYGYVYLESHEKFVNPNSSEMLLYTGDGQTSKGAQLINNYARLHSVVENYIDSFRYIKLVQDIEYNISNIKGDEKKQVWKPVAFKGEFNGNNLNIRNLDYNISQSNVATYGNNVGMFTVITDKSIIKDLTISNMGLNQDNGFKTYTEKVEEKTVVYAGALAGTIKGPNSSNKVTISNVNAIGLNSTNRKYDENHKANYAVYGGYAGGLVGYAENVNVTNCFSSVSATAFSGRLKGTAKSDGSQGVAGSAGGIAGYAYNSSFTNCTSKDATIIGGNALHLSKAPENGADGSGSGGNGKNGGNGINGVHGGNAGGIIGMANTCTVTNATINNLIIKAGNGGDATHGGNGGNGANGRTGTSGNKNGGNGGRGGNSGNGGAGGNGGSAGGAIGYAINVYTASVNVIKSKIEGGAGGRGGNTGNAGNGGNGGNGYDCGYFENWPGRTYGGNGGNGGNAGTYGQSGLGGAGGNVGYAVGATNISSTSGISATYDSSTKLVYGKAGVNGSWINNAQYSYNEIKAELELIRRLFGDTIYNMLLVLVNGGSSGGSPGSGGRGWKNHWWGGRTSCNDGSSGSYGSGSRYSALTTTPSVSDQNSKIGKIIANYL